MWWGHLANQNLVQRYMEGCVEVYGGTWRWWGKNHDFMLIRFLNADIWLDVVGTLNQSESCAEVLEGTWRGAWRCVQRCVEGCAEVHGGAQRCKEGLAEVVGKKSRFYGN